MPYLVCRQCGPTTHHSKPDDWCARNCESSVF
ncbi:hypothetical protein CPT_Menos_054 [Burkholderia phage Menos]|uniref:Uncharacterized protein n=1 Tax=Burkholderia phage Menos TaxID=2924900 RepID=A0AAE9G6Z5_9CAUD|nr:hypothetical protein CPT_Menos_054 [Burkholderia phage Menos]